MIPPYFEIKILADRPIYRTMAGNGLNSVSQKNARFNIVLYLFIFRVDYQGIFS